MPHNYIILQCPECGTEFEVPHSMRGGVSNCPDCGRLVPIQGGFEIAYGLLVGAGLCFVLAVSAAFYFIGGVMPAVIVFGIGGLILTILAVAA